MKPALPTLIVAAILCALCTLANADGLAGKWVGRYVPDKDPKKTNNLGPVTARVKIVITLRPDSTFHYKIVPDPKDKMPTTTVQGTWTVTGDRLYMHWRTREGRPFTYGQKFSIVNKGKNFVLVTEKPRKDNVRLIFSRQ